MATKAAFYRYMSLKAVRQLYDCCHAIGIVVADSRRIRKEQLTALICDDIDLSIARFRAVNVIARRWRLAICDPKFKICRDRLLREFNGLMA